MAEISASTRRELVLAVGGRYRMAQPDERQRILDEFVAVTGYHREHAIRVLNSPSGATASSPPRGRLTLYGEAVRQALVVLWERVIKSASLIRVSC